MIFLRLKRSSYGTSLLTTYASDYVYHLVQLQKHSISHLMQNLDNLLI